MVDLLPVDEDRLDAFLVGVGIDTSTVSSRAVSAVLHKLNAILNSCVHVAEIDVNPLVVDGSAARRGLVALDGVVVLRDERDADGPPRSIAALSAEQTGRRVGDRCH